MRSKMDGRFGQIDIDGVQKLRSNIGWTEFGDDRGPKVGGDDLKMNLIWQFTRKLPYLPRNHEEKPMLPVCLPTCGNGQ